MITEDVHCMMTMQKNCAFWIETKIYQMAIIKRQKSNISMHLFSCKCSNLSVDIVLIVPFTINGMCTKNNNHIYVAQTSNRTVIMACDLHCCLLPQCEALCTCRSGFLIATHAIPNFFWVGLIHIMSFTCNLRNAKILVSAMKNIGFCFKKSWQLSSIHVSLQNIAKTIIAKMSLSVIHQMQTFS